MKKLFLLLVAVLAIGLSASAQTRTVTGTVTDAVTNEPLIGATVVPTGTTKGVVTDIDGKFSISIPASVSSLTISYVGYTPRDVKVKDKLSVALDPSAKTLENIVVTGYGSGKQKGTMTGAVAVVGSEALEHVTTPNFVDALQGKVPGLTIASNSGEPSSGSNVVRIRGVNSLSVDSSPLYILDGAPITETVFNTINPNDIENITVLKDAASVAIYGSRAANGVIVITSKKGKYAEKASVNIRAKMGWSSMVKDNVTMMDSKQYIEFRDKIGQPVSDDMRYAGETLGINTNWRNEIFNGKAPTYSIEAAVSGGTEKNNYYLSLNHMEQEGIIAQSNLRRETLRVSLSSTINDWFRVGIQTNAGYQKYQRNSEASSGSSDIYTSNPMVFARMALPMDSPQYYTIENGQAVYAGKASYLHYSQLITPEYVQSIRSIWNNRVTFNGNLWEEIRPIDGLLIRCQQAIDSYDSRYEGIRYAYPTFATPMGDIYPQNADAPNPGDMNSGSNQQSFSRYYQFTYTNTAEYRKRFNGVHNMTLLIGQESIIGRSSGFQVATLKQLDRRRPLLTNGTETNMNYVAYSLAEKTLNSYFGSASYNYAEKYFFDASIRRDASSSFAPGHRWGTFWSVGGMWNLKQEEFTKKLTWLDDARVHVSYGSNGNSGIGEYMFYGIVGESGLYGGESALGVSNPANPDLTWETVRGWNAGFNAALFHKLAVGVDFYNKETVDMLMAIPFSATTGFGSGTGNASSMRNRGVDLEVSYTPIQSKDWIWEIHANANYNDNEITKLYDGQDELVLSDYGFIYRVGKRANEFYLVKYAGVDPRDGQQMWYTKEGNLTKSYNEVRDAVGMNKSQYAPWSGGFGTMVSWKGLTLRGEFNWAIGKYMLSNDLYFIQNSNFAQSFNQVVDMLDIWTTPGQVTNIPAVGQTLQFDSHLLENASYLRLKTLTLQYAMPQNLVNRMRLEGLSVYFTGRNLLTFTKFSGYDPEPESNLAKFPYPNTRQFEFGIDVSF